MRATGANPRMARAQGISTSLYIYVGMALSNALVGLAGALFAQTNGFADVTAGVGTIVVGLAAVIVGETLFRSRHLWVVLIGCVVGSILYRIAIQLALSFDAIGLRAVRPQSRHRGPRGAGADPAAPPQGRGTGMIRVAGLVVTFARGTPLEKTRAQRHRPRPSRPASSSAIIGSNGAGKSTLLSAHRRRRPADRRPHRHRRRSTSPGSRPRGARRGSPASSRTRSPAAAAQLTIEENLALAAARGTPSAASAPPSSPRGARFSANGSPRSASVSRRRLHDRMALLSGGQRQALALVMATLAPSSVLLLDEHTAALDPGMAEFVIDLTRRTVEDHRLTTLMVTHSMRQALDLGTRTVMLHEGRIVLDVGGAERSSLTVEDLVAMFRRQRGQTLDDDELLIG